MVLEKSLIRRVVLLGTFALVTSMAADPTLPTPSPALLVAITSSGEHALAIVNPLTNKVVARVPITGRGGHPHEVAASPDGKLAFVTIANYAHLEPEEAPEPIPAAFISVIDVGAQKELRRIEIGLDSTPHGIVFAGSKVFFTAEGYKLIGRYDPDNNKIDWMFGTGQIGTHMLVVSKDMTKIFASSLISDSVVAIEPHDEHRAWPHPYPHASAHPWMETVIPVGDEPEGIAMSPDEKEVWTLNKGAGSVSIINVATKKVSQTVNLNEKLPLRIKFTPDGKRVLIIAGENGDVLVLDAVTRKEIKRITNLGLLHGLAIASDGSKAYVTARAEKNIPVIDLKTLQVSGRIATGARIEGIAWAERR